MMWQSSLPVVAAIAERPPLVTAMKWCGCEADFTASAAMRTLPSVPFLKPSGQDSPEASSRWIWLSVVRAPIAAHATRSAMYCGDPHHDLKPIGQPLAQGSEPFGVFDGGRGIMDRAGADDDQEALVATIKDGVDRIACGQ